MEVEMDKKKPIVPSFYAARAKFESRTVLRSRLTRWTGYFDGRTMFL